MELPYTIVDGIRCYAPDLAFINKDYPAGEFEKSLEIEKSSFWYLSRNRVLKFLFNRYLNTGGDKRVLEVGCGTGFVLKGLSELKYLKLSGADIYLDGLKFAREKCPELEFVQLDATKIPFHDEYDVVGAFDVIEHIEEDVKVLENLNLALKPDGLLFLTVPQHMFLWSKTDEIGFHKRRYSRNELLDKLNKTGFEAIRVTSFVFTLLPFMILSRTINKFKKVEAGDTSNHPGTMANFVFDKMIRLDELMIEWGWSLPVGGSLVVVAKKKK